MSIVNFAAMPRRRLITLMMLAAMLVMMTVTAFAQTPVPAPSIDLDVTPLFDSMNSYIPLFLGIFAIPGGIVIAIALVRMLINLVSGAIKGASSGK